MNRNQKKLLLELFKIPAPTGKEIGVQVFIMNFLDRHNIPYHVDKMGNIFNILQDERPLLSAHMDTVQHMKDCRNIKLITLKGNILKGKGVIGGDDKCGIFIILQLLLTREELDFNFLFTVEEECGGHGAREFVERQDLSHISYGLILDRRGNGDILCILNNYGTMKFEDALWLIGDEFGYEPEMGIFSDANYLREWFSCANLSVGYYNAHTKYEYVDIILFLDSIYPLINPGRLLWIGSIEPIGFGLVYDSLDVIGQFVPEIQVPTNSADDELPHSGIHYVGTYLVPFLCVRIGSTTKSAVKNAGLQ